MNSVCINLHRSNEALVCYVDISQLGPIISIKSAQYHVSLFGQSTAVVFTRDKKNIEYYADINRIL